MDHTDESKHPKEGVGEVSSQDVSGKMIQMSDSNVQPAAMAGHEAAFKKPMMGGISQ